MHYFFPSSRTISKQTFCKLYKIKLYFFSNFPQSLIHFLFLFFSASSMFSNIYLMCEITQTLQNAEEIFLHYIEEIEINKISDISIRRALKKYDVKNLKIHNVTPLRAKKMYAAIIPKYTNNVFTSKSWLQNQRRLFIWCTLCYLHKNSLEIYDLKLEDFEFLKKMFPLKELDLIKFQIYSLIKKDNKSSSWKHEQDELLKQLVKKQDFKLIQWSNISKQFFAKSDQKYFRNAKQCRQRWLNHLDPNKIKTGWQPEQDIILLTQVKQRGKKWSKIVQSLDGKKNEHMIKNRYKSLIHKKQKNCKIKNLKQKDIIEMILKQYSQGNNNEIQHEQSEEQSEEQMEQKMEKNQEEDQKQDEGFNHMNYQKQIQKKQQNGHQPTNFLVSCRNWPIIIQHKPQKMQQSERQNGLIINDIQICGNKADKDILNNLFINVGTPVPDESRIPSIILQSRSPAPQNLFLSPFPAACWTPTNFFLVDDTQNLLSPQTNNNDFATRVRNGFFNFVQEK